MALLAVTNSRCFEFLVQMQMAFGSYEVGVIQRTPIPNLSSADNLRLSELARRIWSLKRELDSHVETSHAFTVPALLQVEGNSFVTRVAVWTQRARAIEAEIALIQAGIDGLCFDRYCIDDSDRRVITDAFGYGSNRLDDGIEGNQDAHVQTDDEDNSDGSIDSGQLAAELLAWTVGVAFGRFDVRLATGERTRPPEPEPFDRLPICSPGMLTGGDGLPATDAPVGYLVEPSRVLVDDPGHRLDIRARVRLVFDTVFGDGADRWWIDIGSALGANGGEVGAWLGDGFFDHHLKTYSKSRRKAPILWPIGTRSGSYLVWLHAHYVSADSLFLTLNDVVVPKLMMEERELTRLRQDAGLDTTASQRKAIDAKEGFVGELRELRELLEAVAPLWAPDLNDGIVVVLAPVWQLFAHHRAWSAELKQHWVKLAKGHYDWAQLAMHLWPERVIPKCAEDRSLAIAHGVEDVFWVRDSDREDTWHRRQIPATSVDDLIGQRRDPAVSAALERVSNR